MNSHMFSYLFMPCLIGLVTHNKWGGGRRGEEEGRVGEGRVVVEGWKGAGGGAGGGREGRCFFV